MDTITLEIGNESYRIRPFRAFKAIHAGDIVASVSQQVQHLLDESESFTRAYAETHRIRITKDVADARGFELPEGRDFVDLPAEPSTEQKVMKVFPEAFSLAKEEVMQLLALVVIEDRDLQTADENDEVKEVLGKLGKRLVYNAEMGELIELLVAAIEMVKSQIAERKEALGKLRGVFSRNSPATPPDGGTSSTATEPEGEVVGYNHRIEVAKITQEPESVPVTPVPDSSTSSPTPTDGDASEPSSELDIERSLSSATS